jgi:serine/threonine protein phosphatase PrpC
VQFLPLGMAIPEDHPDRNRYLSMAMRAREIDSSDLAEITLMSPGDILVMYTDGVYDGSDEQDRRQIENVIREHQNEPAKVICNAILAYAVQQDEQMRRNGEEDRVDDKTAFIIKRG